MRSAFRRVWAILRAYKAFDIGLYARYRHCIVKESGLSLEDWLGVQNQIRQLREEQEYRMDQWMTPLAVNAALGGIRPLTVCGSANGVRLTLIHNPNDWSVVPSITPPREGDSILAPCHYAKAKRYRLRAPELTFAFDVIPYLVGEFVMAAVSPPLPGQLISSSRQSQLCSPHNPEPHGSLVMCDHGLFQISDHRYGSDLLYRLDRILPVHIYLGQ